MCGHIRWRNLRMLPSSSDLGRVAADRLQASHDPTHFRRLGLLARRDEHRTRLGEGPSLTRALPSLCPLCDSAFSCRPMQGASSAREWEMSGRCTGIYSFFLLN